MDQWLAFWTAGLSALIAALVALATTRWQISSELKRLQAEIERTYEIGVFDKRLSIYPEGCSIISEYLKCLRWKASFDWGAFEKFREHWLSWDTSESYLFGYATSNLTWLFQQFIYSFPRNEQNEVDEKDREILILTLARIEWAMKVELGTFGIEPIGKLSSDYKKISKRLKKRLKKLNCYTS